MTISRASVLETVLKAYKNHFDIERFNKQDGLVAKAIFHSRTEKFILTKSVKMWGVETNDYVYIYSLPYLNNDHLAACKEQSVQDGLQQIHPHKEHMCSYITAIILADDLDSQMVKDIKSCSFSKNFLLTFHGWAILRVLVINISTSTIIPNRAGRELVDFLTSCLKEAK